MRIGIISKKEHAQAHKAVLEQAGHKVTLLGSTHIVPTGPGWDMIFCRQCSVSHAASDAVRATERRLVAQGKSRPIISYAESVTSMLAAAREAEAELAAKSVPAAINASRRVCRSPFGLFRAYPDDRRGADYWDLRFVDNKTRKMKYIGNFRGSVEAAQDKVDKREREYLVQPDSAAASAPVEPVAVEPVAVEPVAVSAPHPAVVALLNGEVAGAIEPEPKLEAKTPEPESDPLPDALLVALLDVERAMIERGLDVVHYARLTIRLTALHLKSPDGIACNAADKAHATTSVGEVTCKLCRRSKFFQTAQWVALNLKS